MGNEHEIPVESTYTPLGDISIPQNIPCERKKSNANYRSQLLIETEILRETNCRCLSGIITVYNKLYRFGFLLAYFVLLLLTLIVAPIFGLIGGILEFVTSLVRGVLRPIGRMVADSFGYGSFLSLSTEKLQRELDV